MSTSASALQHAPRTVFILGVSSDIGRALAERYLRDRCRVIGTCRNTEAARDLAAHPAVSLLSCDVSQPASVTAAVSRCRELSAPWDLFISCVGSMEPIGRFFSCDFAQWEQSVALNSTAQLHLLHALYPLRKRGTICDVAFFAGGGTNNAVTNYSAYCVGKIALMKMCELLDDEAEDLNAFIIGPGWVRTRMLEQTLRNPAGAGHNFARTAEFLASDDPGTSLDDIYDCLNWCTAQGREVIGGRNLSVKYDAWRGGGAALAERLRQSPSKFRLRRFENEG